MGFRKKILPLLNKQSVDRRVRYDDIMYVNTGWILVDFGGNLTAMFVVHFC